MANEALHSTTAYALRVPRMSSGLADHRKAVGSTADQAFVDYNGKVFLVKVGHVEGSQEYQKFYGLVEQKTSTAIYPEIRTDPYRETEQRLTPHDTGFRGSYDDYPPFVREMRAISVRELKALRNHLEEYSRGIVYQQKQMTPEGSRPSFD